LDAAIVTASRYIQNDNASEPDDVETEIEFLNSKIADYSESIGTGEAAFNSDIAEVIQTAERALFGVWSILDSSSNPGADVPNTVYWAYAGDITTLENAIEAAREAAVDYPVTVDDQENVEAAILALETAITEFVTYKKHKGELEYVSKVALGHAIDAAYEAKADVFIDTDGWDTLIGGWWVTQETMTALNNTISAAELVYGNTAATTSEVASILGTLTGSDRGSTAWFNGRKAAGTKPLNKDELLERIEDAYAELGRPILDSELPNGSDVAPGIFWVTPEMRAGLQTAYNNAVPVGENREATTEAVTVVLDPLIEARNAWEPKDGTRPASASITITFTAPEDFDLPQFQGKTLSLRNTSDTISYDVRGATALVFWTLDGANYNRTTNPIVMSASGLSIGLHYITVVFTTGGQTYSKEVRFTVTN
jgi:hypothetical protein